MEIRQLHNSKIDYKQWDNLVLASPKASIFHFSWYLEVTDDDWSALICGDYEWGLPYISKKKHISLHQTIPYLGIISKRSISEKEFEQIINFWNKNNIQIDYTFSKYHFPYQKNQNLIRQPFFQKDLIHRYETIANNYTPQLQKTLKQAQDNKLVCRTLRSLFQFIELYKKTNQTSPENTIRVQKVILRAIQVKAGKMYGLYNDKNELIGAAFILFSNTKAYLMFSAFTHEVYHSKGDYKLVNSIIEDLSNYIVTLENHCSNFNGRLWKSFGFRTYYSYEYHYHAKQNLLSLLIQYLKL